MGSDILLENKGQNLQILQTGRKSQMLFSQSHMQNDFFEFVFISEVQSKM